MQRQSQASKPLVWHLSYIQISLCHLSPHHSISRSAVRALACRTPQDEKPKNSSNSDFFLLHLLSHFPPSFNHLPRSGSLSDKEVLCNEVLKPPCLGAHIYPTRTWGLQSRAPCCRRGWDRTTGHMGQCLCALQNRQNCVLALKVNSRSYWCQACLSLSVIIWKFA